MVVMRKLRVLGRVPNEEGGAQRAEAVAKPISVPLVDPRTVDDDQASELSRPLCNDPAADDYDDVADEGALLPCVEDEIQQA